MIETTLREVADLCGGTLSDPSYGNRTVKGVSTNSRKIDSGVLFVPLQGERFDGHLYADQALKDGAAAAMWQSNHDDMPQGYPLIMVDNTLEALQRLAQAYLAQQQVKVVAITGSNGKTTTKDMIASVLAERYRVHKTDGNFNNHIGLPLTILSMPKDTEIAVLEMGMSGRGEIELLSSIAQPDAAVITNIGEAHLLQLGSREEIARAKLEITSGLRENGVLICHGDEPLVDMALSEEATKRPEHMSVIRFGAGMQCDVRPEHIDLHEAGTTFTVAASGSQNALTVELPLLGKHNVINALAAVAIGRLFGLTDEQIAHGLGNAQISGMRFERTITSGGWVLLNDAYNASPTATKAALDVLAELQGGKRIAILGDMLELGPNEARLHYEVGASIRPGSLDLLLTYGELGREIGSGALQHFAENAVYSFDDKAALKACLLQHVQAGDTVLVKASRGMKLEEVVNEWTSVHH
ncbi:UDP-N-acetylmuramoyl-tripeptide--D-alanyl-D-alanine ligase [Paenibacillus sp. UNC217MF]|uniref:UDP-N-acetylmuramoyl-tripeptide--D-alanyl-D- alanine ligase n=1 Tax=Paenibacillus sp. UNC217MF TaxID=1449062 RepID=UPI00048B7A20|nr:UDP-N-acetylmuramoyl-tripeptide--D-alanyl-D-alanine ligase [Paenibacillus sp. UNC217MF]